MIRLSAPSDIPALRRLWELAFGDGGPYLDNFFDNYYRPERMIVLEREGEILSMTAWFDTDFVVPGRGAYRAAYLYAVATHPDCRGEGLSGRVQVWVDEYFRGLGIPAVTTVPAEPSLHRFFGANGFRECFAYDEVSIPAATGPAPFELESLTPEDYADLREAILRGTPHIRLAVDAVTYQAGCSAISGGGLYAAQTPEGVAILCTEGMGDGTLLVKELLGTPEACEIALEYLDFLLPHHAGICRIPGKSVPFGMLKWLDEAVEREWNWDFVAYLGLAFD